ncbi:MAG: STAS domain-containing protein [Thermodesulfobacteriota bacterium]
MEIIEERQEATHIFHLHGRLDSHTASQLEDRLQGSLHGQTRSLIIDCSDLEYVSSAGLRVILKATKEMQRQEGRLILCAMQDYVREVFDVSGFSTFIPIVPGVTEALRTL